MSANTTRGKLFYAEAVKGYILKVMIDALAMQMSRTIFKASKTGFYHRQSDDLGHVLFDVEFSRGNFRPYRCKEEFIFSINLKHLQRLVRNVKKKDSVILFITHKRPDRLWVSIRPCGSISSGHNARIETVSVTITRIEDSGTPPIGLPDIIEEKGRQIQVYGYPMVIDASEFQKVKKLTTVGKTMFIEMQASNYLSFFSDNGELYDSKIEFGEIVDDPEEPSLIGGEENTSDREEYDEGDYEDEVEEKDHEEESDGNEDDDEDDKEIKGWWESTFPMSIFNMLLKLPGLCSQMQFFAPRIERYPLKVKVFAGTLGPICVYIKDSVQIAYEQTKKDDERRQVEEKSSKSSKKRSKSS